MSRLKDPVHFFDARGRSVLSNDHLEAENDRLTKENADLKRRLKAVMQRLKGEIAQKREDESTN